MKLKRLKSTTFTVCQIFCSDRLKQSYNDFSKLGSIIFKYNFLSKKMVLEGKLSGMPTVCLELDDFLKRELDSIGVSNSQLDKAELKVHIKIDKKKNLRTTRTFYRCHIHAECKIEIQHREFIGQYDDVREWPEELHLRK